MGRGRTKARGVGDEAVVRTVLFSDVVDSTGILHRLKAQRGAFEGERTYRENVLRPHDDRLAACFAQYGGHAFKNDGDSYVVAFVDARRAVECAVACQRTLGDPTIPTGLQEGTGPSHVLVKIGLHTGDAIRVKSGRDYQGEVLNVARRIQDQAHGGQVLTSPETWERVGDLAGIGAHLWTGYTLKGLSGPRTLVEVLWGDRAPRAPKSAGTGEAPLDTGAAPAAGSGTEGVRRASRTTTDLVKLRRQYLEWLAASYEWIDPIGIAQVRNVVRVRLDDVFVPLAATGEMPEGDALRERAVRSAKRREAEKGAELSGREPAAPRLSLAEALRSPRLVILGDPGSGKTTILKHFARALALGNGAKLGLGGRGAAPLRIVFPISWYAAALRSRERPLSDCLAEYCEMHEQRGLAPLFQDALSHGRAIVLIDGLDEVLDPSERARVVHQVNAFVTRYAPPGREKASAAGNRVVVTSRIAGYDAARLSGFTHVTVLPFDDDDIERFCAQWCRAHWDR